MERRHSGSIADVAEGDADVSEQAAAFGAKDRRIGKAALESSFIEGEEFDQIGLGQIISSVRLHDLAFAREAVPRANRKAVVAAVNSIANGAAKFDRNRAFEFN